VLPSLGRFSFRHRKLVLLAWVVVLLAGFTIGTEVFGRLSNGGGGDSWESVQGFQRLDDEGAYGERLSAIVDGAPADDQKVRDAVMRAVTDIEAMPGVARVVDPYRVPLPDLRSVDRRAGLVAVDLDREVFDPQRVLDAAAKRLRAIPDDAPGTQVTVSSFSLTQDEINEQVRRDTELGEFIALPLTLVVMVVIFGGLAAAGVPFLGAIASIAGGLLTLLGFTYLLDDTEPNVVSVTTVMGLGLSIDYSLLIVSRYREERGRGLDPEAAVERTSATAGRTITFSALTVATSLAGLFIFPTPIFRSLAAAGVGVVLVALLAGLTLAPALIAMFGRRIKAPTTPVPDDGFFARLARRVQRHAVLVALAVTTVLVLCGLPFLHVQFQNGGANLLPRQFESRQFVDLLDSRFTDRGTEPILVVADASLPQMQAYAATLDTLDGVLTVRAPEQTGDLVTLEVVPDGSSQGETARRLVSDLRENRPDFPTWVTGDAAILVDFNTEVSRAIPWALGLVVLATFCLLFLMTGSVLVPAKALVMNTLSLCATFGALVWIFPDGHLSGLLGFTPTGGLETWVPVIVFAFAFGLSMDYEVFLLSRVKELYDAGYSNDEAVVLGLQRSGRIITSAALLVVIVFAGFAAGKMLGVKEMGLALAVAVAIDATLVRCLLVPATMTLLGDWNWWAPQPLRRLHDRLGLHEHPEPAQPPRRETAGIPD
jgi:RND superfamily putative drug exporter